jgi:hypothetical protein
MTEPPYLPRHFRPQELVPKALFELMGNGSLRCFDREVLQALDALRAYHDRPVTINTWHTGGTHQWRGFRSVSCPVGAVQSRHKLGVAFDLAGPHLQMLLEQVLEHGRSFRIHRLEEPKVTMPRGYIHVEFGPDVPKFVKVFKP